MSGSTWKVALGVLLLLAVLLAACGGTGAPPAKETVVVPQTVIVPQTVVVEKQGAPPAVATAAPKAEPPVAILNIVPVAANAKDPNVITATLKYVTDTAVGPATTTVATGDPGLTNHALNWPVHLAASTQNSNDKVTSYAWTLTAPKDSKAALKDAKAAATEFTPDVVGAYKVDVSVKTDAGSSSASVQLNVGTYIGNDATACKQCHAGKVDEWLNTGHAKIFTDNINNSRTPDVATHYSEGCIRCHTTGYTPGAQNGGFTDVQAQLKWQLPTFKEIDSHTSWNKVPQQLQALANIQCEVCHGPAKEHATTGAKVMDASFDNGTCDVCHNGGGHHVKGGEIEFSKHSDATAMAWTEPTGPAEQACVRCHSGKGYASFIANPTNQAAWNNEAQTVGCSTCHDPHSEKNVFQLRIVGKPVSLPFDAKDAGLSATCEECHNSRQTAANAVKGSFPHYSSAAELLNDTGGVDYGQKISDSPHGKMVGTAPIPNPAAKDDPEAAKYMFTAAGAKEGNVPGACVTCHMWPTTADTKDPNYLKVGEHSFNTVSPDGKTDYTASCTQCHGPQTTFNFKAKADYDGNGKVEGVKDEVKGLLNVLWKALESKGLKKVDTGYPYANVPKNADGTIDPKIANAWYNFRTVYGVMWGEGSDGNQGAGAAIHNFSRSVSLLQLSYKDLTGQDVPGATLMVK